MSSRFRVGTSGWRHDHWRGAFCPEDLPDDRWFAWYADHFDAVEIATTFYHLPDPGTFAGWRARAPEGFLYVLQFSRYGSHLKCLRDPEQTIGNFTANSGPLGDRRGPILVQLRPHCPLDVDRLDSFLAAAPAEQRWAVEFRDPAWLCPEVYGVLRAHGAALCIHDLIAHHPLVVTSDWVYLRFHGDHRAGGYLPAQLAAWAQRIQGWLTDGRDVFAFFTNDLGAHAPANALELRRRVEN